MSWMFMCTLLCRESLLTWVPRTYACPASPSFGFAGCVFLRAHSRISVNLCVRGLHSEYRSSSTCRSVKWRLRTCKCGRRRKRESFTRCSFSATSRCFCGLRASSPGRVRSLRTGTARRRIALGRRYVDAPFESEERSIHTYISKNAT